MRKLVIKKKPQAYKYDPYRDGVSQSCLATFLNCREQARLRYVHQLEEKRERLCFKQGKRYDEILKHYYENINSYETPEEAKRSLVEHIRDNTKKELVGASNREEIEQDAGIAEVLLPAYIDHHWKYDRRVSWQEQGKRFDDIPIYTHDKKKVNLKGEFDGTFLEGTKRGLIENKFFSRVSDNLLDILALDLQLGFYFAADYEARLAIFNITRKPSLRRKVSESLKDFLARIREDIKGRDDWYFTRVRLQISKREKREAYERARSLVTEFCRWWQYAKDTPIKQRDLLWNSSQCESKYGACPYLQACANKAYSDYKERERC